jgi:uncharacterized protein (TIGR00255 family)
MIVSMTGFGKTELNLPQKKVSIEIKSLNSKNVDMNVRMSSFYREKELEVRQAISKALKRGKIDVGIYVELTGGEKTQSIDKDLFTHYYKEMESLRDELGGGDSLMNLVMRMPEVMKSEKEELSAEEWETVAAGIQESIKRIQAFRADEGKVLAADFEQRIATIGSLLNTIEQSEEMRINNIRERIQDKLKELEEVDNNRLEQELIYYIEKLDVTEEMVRLKNHLSYFLETMNATESQGKKLGFICQEIGREINTIGSKSNNASMQQIVVQMKDELEKIKEQMLNVL